MTITDLAMLFQISSLNMPYFRFVDDFLGQEEVPFLKVMVQVHI